MFTKSAKFAAVAVTLAGLSACATDPEQEARELCQERVAAESIRPDAVEWISEDDASSVEGTYFFVGQVDFPAAGRMVRQVYRCTVNPEIEGIIFNETKVTPAY